MGTAERQIEMDTELPFLFIILFVAFALVGISVVAKRFEMNDRVVKVTFGAAFFFLSFFLVAIAMIFFVGDLYADWTDDYRHRLIVEGGYQEYNKAVSAVVSEYGWARIYAKATFGLAGAGLIMCMLSPLVEPPVDGDVYTRWFLIPLAIGIILLIGLPVLIDWLGSVLAIVTTVIGILVGIKTLAATETKR